MIELIPRRESLANPFLAAACEDARPDRVLRFAGPLVLYAPVERFAHAVEAMGSAFARLLEPFGGRTLTCLQASPRGRWPTRRRTPPILAEAARAFRSFGAGKSFDGGLRLDANEAAAVIEPVMWSVRMDMGYGPVYIAPDHGSFTASFCQYGNLHFDVYDSGALRALREAAASAGLAEETDGCDERFAAGGAIPGRALSLGRGG